jgi:hypothetical protein
MELRHIPLPPAPHFGERPNVPADDYAQRMDALYAESNMDWVIVYADREHIANTVFLCNFDPRFEEALLVLGQNGKRVLLVGNEDLDYISVVCDPALAITGVLCQSLSLMGQPRSMAPRLVDVLRGVGVASGARVGVVGWKYLEAFEADTPTEPAFVPAMFVRALRAVVGADGALVDVTHVLMHPTRGLKSRNSAAQLSAYAWAAAQASSAVLRIVRGARPGMSEREAARLMDYRGDPMSCHMMMVSGSATDAPIVGLRSPSGRSLAYGDGVTTAVGYWGSLCARAGTLRGAPDPSFVSSYVTPYFAAIAAWWQTLRIGVTGDEMNSAVMRALDGAVFMPALNPGHLIATDEWTHSPIRPGSDERIASGMALQCDIIPSPMPAGLALNCEDTVAIAGEALQAQLRATDPALWARIQAQRTFMREALGIVLADEVLPLSVACAYLPPFWLMGDWVCVNRAE